MVSHVTKLAPSDSVIVREGTESFRADHSCIAGHGNHVVGGLPKCQNCGIKEIVLPCPILAAVRRRKYIPVYVRAWIPAGLAWHIHIDLGEIIC